MQVGTLALSTPGSLGLGISGSLRCCALQRVSRCRPGEEKSSGRGRVELGNKQFYFEHPHPLWVEILWGWALRDSLGLGTHCRARHSKDTEGRRVPGEGKS